MVKIAASLFVGVQAGILDVTWSDCGAKHAKVDSLAPLTIKTGGTTTLVGSGIVDEDVTGAKFTAKVSAHGAPLASCEGDGTQDTVCKLPLGAGTITVKKVAYPFAKGSRVPISVDVQTSLLIPASLASVDTAIRATDLNGESVICMDVHTAQQAELEAMVGGTLDVTWSDCGAKHAKVDTLAPLTIKTGGTTTLVGSGIVDEDITGAKFTAKVSAHGAPLASCEGDGTQDTVCKLPLGAGTITVKKVAYPFAKGSRVALSVDVQTSLLIPASLASVDTAIRATDLNGESVICMDVHTAQQEVIV